MPRGFRSIPFAVLLMNFSDCIFLLKCGIYGKLGLSLDYFSRNSTFSRYQKIVRAHANIDGEQHISMDIRNGQRINWVQPLAGSR